MALAVADGQITLYRGARADQVIPLGGAEVVALERLTRLPLALHRDLALRGRAVLRVEEVDALRPGASGWRRSARACWRSPPQRPRQEKLLTLCEETLDAALRAAAVDPDRMAEQARRAWPLIEENLREIMVLRLAQLPIACAGSGPASRPPSACTCGSSSRGR
ncbi:MAG: hypothetical protein R3F43_27380 [bacterium]